MHNILKNWPFAEPPETLVLAEKIIIQDNMPILCAARLSKRPGWYFGHAGIVDLEKVVTVRLMDIIAMDRSLTNVSRMPTDWTARKNKENGIWIFAPEPVRFK